MQNLITDVPGVKVGNAEDTRLGSGSTAIIFEEPATASVDIRGGGPGTRETALLDPAQTVGGIDAIAAELKAKGVEFTKEPTTIRPGVRICFIRGPQGISIELLERDQKYA